LVPQVAYGDGVHTAEFDFDVDHASPDEQYDQQDERDCSAGEAPF
jgi:hypothetical protein